MRCVHCLRELEKSTKDHVFPKAWYPDDTPDSVQRLTVPTCLECNNKLGALERELFINLACCVDPNKTSASGINTKLMRTLGLGNEDELSSEELAHRRKSLLKLLEKSKPYDGSKKAFPGLGPHDGYPENEHMILPVPVKELKAVSLKIIKGLEYIHNDKRYIEPPFEVKINFIEENQKINQIFEKHGVTTEIGPGFVVQRVGSSTPTGPVLYKVKIWDTLILYGSINDRK